jgi:DNA helicase-2/ATP-dependent DNA helicase PcrA
MPFPFLAGLNPQQLEAVTLPHESALILAGAGSGKTRVLTTRIAYLIQTGQASPQEILAVTFTNKAAREMLTRLSAMLPINTRGMWVGTFHGLCNRLLRTHHREAGLPALFQILDSQDQLAAIKRLLKTLNVDDERYPPKQVQYFINSAKEQGLRAEGVDAPDEHTRRLRELFAAYDEQCNREGVVDFAELLLRSFELLSRDTPVRGHYQDRFRYLLVDEFQDTNPLQYAWLRLLAGTRNAVFAVGDDDQSIYAFRGARVGNMQDLERDFGVRRIIRLEQNYRSHGNILDAANALIRHNRGRLGKNLWTAEQAGEPVRLFQAATDREEAVFIVEEVSALRREGVALSDIAVVYRSNAQSRVLEHALFNAGLPYRVYGGMRFFERQEIKHALAYLRLVASPEDDTALLRVINFPARGIGARSLEQLQETARQAGVSLWQAAVQRLGGGAKKGIDAFVQLMEALREACAGLPLPEQIEHMLAASGLVAHYQGGKEGADRVENLNELVNAAAAFAADSEDGSLTAFLTHAALEAGEHQAATGTDALQLMTVHAAKGLEFHTVFVSGLEEGLFPHENAVAQTGPGGFDGIEEERRLMYVAITRARRRLYLSFAESRMLHGQFRYGMASRFLHEIPADFIKRLNGAVPPWGEGEAHPAPVSPPPAGPAEPAWRVGQGVVHPKFGAGVIVDCEGRGTDARVQVNFSDSGLKWLALEYAKLTPA